MEPKILVPRAIRPLNREIQNIGSQGKEPQDL